MKNTDSGNQKLITGAPGSTLLFFALPMILGNLFQQFYNMADSVIVGRFVGENELAAVGASYSFITVFIMIAIGSGIGASVLTGQYFGAKEYAEMKTSAYTALISFLIFSVFISAAGYVFNPAILRALKTPENIFDEAVLYLRIYFLGMPFVFMYNVLAANFNALGRSKVPLFLLIFSSLFNVVLDIIMVTVFGLGVAGVAIATVIAQSISALISLGILLRILDSFDSGDKKAGLFDSGMLIREIRIAIPSTVQQSIVSIGMLLMQSSVNAFGSSALAGYSAGSRVESVCIVPMISMGNAVSNYTAQNLGAGRPDRVKLGLNAAFRIDAVFALLLALVSLTCAGHIMSCFTVSGTSGVTFNTGLTYIRFIGMFYIIIGIKAATDGVLRGSGDTGVYMAANLINLSIRVGAAKLLSPVLGIDVIWWAIPAGWLANALISYMWYRRGHWKKSLV